MDWMPGDIPDYLFLCWLVLIAIQLAFYLFVFLRLGMQKQSGGGNAKSPVTVVICARNELENLHRNLKHVLGQEYESFRVHVVNDCSWDNSDKALEEYEDAYPNLKVVTIRENERYRHGKKFALTMGIKSAESETLLFTDADCRPASTDWINMMSRHIQGETEIVIGYGAYEKGRGLLNKWIRFDTFFNAMQYLSYAMAGIPYMGTGRNLCYTRDLFFRNKGFAGHHHVISGDDDLFVNEAAHGGNTTVETGADSFTYSRAADSFRQWLRQKKRHMSTAKHYKILHKLLLGMFYATQIGIYAGLAVLLVAGYAPAAVLSVFGLRMMIQVLVFGLGMKKLKELDLLIFTPFFDLLVVLIYPILAISNMLVKVQEWK